MRIEPVKKLDVLKDGTHAVTFVKPIERGAQTGKNGEPLDKVWFESKEELDGEKVRLSCLISKRATLNNKLGRLMAALLERALTEKEETKEELDDLIGKELQLVVKVVAQQRKGDTGTYSVSKIVDFLKA